MQRSEPADLVYSQLAVAQGVEDRNSQGMSQRFKKFGFEVAKLLSHSLPSSSILRLRSLRLADLHICNFLQLIVRLLRFGQMSFGIKKVNLVGLSSPDAEIKFGRSLSDQGVDPRESLMIFGASGYHLGIMSKLSRREMLGGLSSLLSCHLNVHKVDVSPDDQRFLIGTAIGEPTAPAPTVILNWTAALKK